MIFPGNQTRRSAVQVNLQPGSLRTLTFELPVTGDALLAQFTYNIIPKEHADGVLVEEWIGQRRGKFKGTVLFDGDAVSLRTFIGDPMTGASLMYIPASKEIFQVEQTIKLKIRNTEIVTTTRVEVLMDFEVVDGKKVLLEGVFPFSELKKALITPEEITAAIKQVPGRTQI